MISDEDIDLVLLANVTTQWRKVAFVVGTTMGLMDREERGGRDDLYFAGRVVGLVEKGVIEASGNLSRLRYCEVRLPSKPNDDLPESQSTLRQFPPGWNDPPQPSDNFDKKLLYVRRLSNQALYEETLTQCNRLLLSDPEHRGEILRIRASTFATSGDYKSAVNDYESLVNSGSAELKDYYIGALDAIFADELEKSVGWFETLLRVGREQKETWFESAALFYLSYLYMEFEKFDKATAYLAEAERIEPGGGMPIPNVGMCNHSQLREEIERRRK